MRRINSSYIALTIVFLLVLAILCSTVWEVYVRIFFPTFDGVVFLSGLIFISGMSYALLGRHLFAGILTVASIIALPHAMEWFAVYWPWAVEAVPFFKFIKNLIN